MTPEEAKAIYKEARLTDYLFPKMTDTLGRMIKNPKAISSITGALNPTKSGISRLISLAKTLRHTGNPMDLRNLLKARKAVKGWTNSVKSVWQNIRQ